jgi:hypothetical protein
MKASLQASGDVRLVQFPHPGREHPLPSGGRAPWRHGKALHRRTFLVSPGTYRLQPDGDDLQGDVAFWGEWEGAVDVVTELDPVARGPRWLGRPDPSAEPPSFDDAPPQNTDPYVWGDAFRYTFCRQPTNGKLRRLGRGSLILFGSGLGHGFVLDTVLVVAGWIDHSHPGELEERTDDAYIRATIDPMYGWGTGRTHRLYVGATPSETVNGMYSFVPCQPGNGRDVGFERPVIELGGWIDKNLRQQAKMDARDEAGMRGAWEAVVDVVTSKNLALATELRL